MKKCPHCGQSVRAQGPTCPLCRQDMHRSSSRPEPTDHSGKTRRPHLSPSELTALERLWAGKSDESLEEAANTLLDYTVEGQRVIREELQRRSIPVPGPESQKEASGESLGGRGVPIYSDPDFLLVDALQGALKSHGMSCEIRRSRSGPLSSRPWPELWILDESQTGQARQLVQAALDEGRRNEVEDARSPESDSERGTDRGPQADDEHPQGSVSWAWTCPGCGEDVESQFSECWNCGSERPPESAV